MGGISPFVNRIEAQVRFGGLPSLRFRAALLSAILSGERQGGGGGALDLARLGEPPCSLP